MSYKGNYYIAVRDVLSIPPNWMLLVTLSSAIGMCGPQADAFLVNPFSRTV